MIDVLQKKSKTKRLEQAKKIFQEKLARVLDEKSKRQLAPEPRYDEEFFEGVRWLDSLAGDELLLDFANNKSILG